MTALASMCCGPDVRFKGIALADIWPWRGVVLVMLVGSTGIRNSSQVNVLPLALTLYGLIPYGPPRGDSQVSPGKCGGPYLFESAAANASKGGGFDCMSDCICPECVIHGVHKNHEVQTIRKAYPIIN